MTLRETVERYRALAGSFGRPVELGAFGLAPQETERTFGAFDEDYHLSRFFHFTLAPPVETSQEKVYRINGFPQSHVSLDAEIESVL